MRAGLLGVAVVCAVSMSGMGLAHADTLEDLGKAIDLSPEDAKVYDAYATQAFKEKRFDEAIRKLKIAVARFTDYTEGYYKLAYAYRQKKEWADAADYYRRYTTVNPSRTDTYFGLGAALQGLGDNKGAIAAYEKYVSLEKSPAKQRFVDSARAELAKLDPSRAVAQQPPPATPATPAPVTSSPADIARLRAQAEQARKDGKLDDAASLYRQAIAADRANVELHNELGNVFFAQKRYNDAAQAFRDATAQDAKFALGWYNLAHALRKAERRGDAVDAYRKYIALRPDDPDPYYGLGQTLKALGNTAGAIEAFRKYVAMEKRPEEQKWVDKARAELQALEPAAAPQPSPSGGTGSLEERNTLSGENPSAWTPEGLLNPFVGVSGGQEFAMSSDWNVDPDGLMDPFRARRELREPVDEVSTAALIARATPKQKLRAYGEALAAYRRALSRHAETVSEGYERGVAHVLIDDQSSARRTFDGIVLRDASLDSARKSIERVRQSFVSRR